MEKRFPAMRGEQGGREFYVSVFNYHIIAAIASSVDKNGTQYRGEPVQRKISDSRVKRFVEYLQRERHFVPPVIMSVFGAKFVDGFIVFDSNTEWVVNDGQHRVAGIRQLMSRDTLNDSLPAMLFLDPTLAECQQIFFDLNKHSAKPSLSVSCLLDNNSKAAQLARRLASEVFQGRVEFEKGTIDAKSSMLVSLASVYKAVDAQLSKGMSDSQIIEFWRDVDMWLWSEGSYLERRKRFIDVTALGFEAIAEASPTNLVALSQFDWSREKCPSVIDGRIVKNQKSVTRLANAVREFCEAKNVKST